MNTISTGQSQHSVLGSKFLLIYINDTCDRVVYSQLTINLFADEKIILGNSAERAAQV